MQKAEFIKHWEGLPPSPQILVTPIPYKHEGSTYDCDGIRITGSKAFIDSVLPRLQELLKFEAHTTHLQVVYQQSKDRLTGQPIPDAFNCYIQVHERGGEAIITSGWSKSGAAEANAELDEQEAIRAAVRGGGSTRAGLIEGPGLPERGVKLKARGGFDTQIIREAQLKNGKREEDLYKGKGR